MGRTNQVLRLLVHPSLENHPKILELVEKGHHIFTAGSGDADLSLYDGVLGPTCWMMDESLLDEGLLDVFLKACRKWKKAKKAAAQSTLPLEPSPDSSSA